MFLKNRYDVHTTTVDDVGYDFNVHWEYVLLDVPAYYNMVEQK